MYETALVTIDTEVMSSEDPTSASSSHLDVQHAALRKPTELKPHHPMILDLMLPLNDFFFSLCESCSLGANGAPPRLLLSWDGLGLAASTPGE